MELIDFIQVYDDVLSEEECDHCIKLFEEGVGKQNYYTDVLKFTQYYLPDTLFTSSILNKIRDRQGDYCFNMCETLDCYELWPQEVEFEPLKVKRYVPKRKEEFGRHIDVSDKENCARFLSCLVYLNDVENGGQTVFNDVTIKPKVGRLIVFPPLWMFPHAGKPSISNPKYILGTYLRFI